jgi:hypothetical protein
VRANGSEARDHQELSRGPGQQHRTTAPNPYWKNRQTLSAAIDRSRRCDAKEERLARVAGDGTLSPVTATLASRIHSRSLRHKVYQMSSRTELDGCIPSPRMILSTRPTRQAPAAPTGGVVPLHPVDPTGTAPPPCGGDRAVVVAAAPTGFGQCGLCACK